MRFAKMYVLTFFSLLCRTCIGLIVACTLSAPAKPQEQGNYGFLNGAPSFSPIGKFPGGTINLANGNLHIEIPLGSYPQRGSLQASVKLVYDSRGVWVNANGSSIGGYYTAQSAWGSDNQIGALGWRIVGAAENVLISFPSYSASVNCGGLGGSYQLQLGEYLWFAPDGSTHAFNVEGTPYCINGGAAAIDAYAGDASGFHLFNFDGTLTKIYARDGSLVYSDALLQSATSNICTFTLNDPNGNLSSWTYHPNASCPTSTVPYFPSLTDTLGRQPVTVTYGSGASVTVQVQNSENTTSSTLIQTAFLGTLYTGFGGPGDCLSSSCQGPTGAVQSITLPDGSQYTFTYDCSTSSPYNLGSPAICNSPGGYITPPVYGLMTSMTLPTGGTVNFSYTNFTDSLSFRNRWLTGVSYGGGQWTYTPATGCGTNCQTVTVARPSGSSEVYTFQTSPVGPALNTSIQYFNGATGGTPSLTIQNTFESYPTQCKNPAAPALSLAGQFPHLKNSTVSLPVPAGTLVSQTSYVFDSFQGNCANTITSGKLLSKSEYAFGLGAPGSLVRKTVNTYLDDTNSSYRTNGVATGYYPAPNGSKPIVSLVNIMDRVVDMQVQDGSGNVVAETKTTYDSTPLVSASGIQSHDDSNFGSSYTTRGNATQIQKLLNGSFITVATATYDTTGQVTQAQDANGNTATISYADNFYNDNSPASNPPSGFTPSRPTNAFPTGITLPIIGKATFGYYYGSGKTAFSVDQNGADTYSHFLDPLDRPTHTFLPITNGNRGWTLTTYSVGGTQSDTYSAINDTAPSTSCASCVHSRANLDTFGRAAQNTLVSDPDGQTYTGITYDSSGRTHTISNPYRSASDPTYGVTTYNFDVLGRPTIVSEADGSSVRLYYGADVSGVGGVSSQLCAPSTYGYGFPVLQIDEAGNKKQTWSDALGSVIEVDEPDLTGTLSVATCYTYDTLSDLVKVEQKGGSTDPTQWRVRTFTYDSLARLTQTTNPESGASTYTYDNNGNVLTRTSPAPNQTGSATVTTTYTYDGLNRLKSKTYNDTNTPAPTCPVSILYDERVDWGPTLQNPIGRPTTMYCGSGATFTGAEYSYDATGRLLLYAQCDPSNCGSGDYEGRYTYDLAGNMLSAFFYPGYVISYTYDTAGRPAHVTSNYVDSQHPATLATVDPAVGYWPNGALRKVALGNGLYDTAAYNNRLQPCRMNTNSTSTFTLTLCSDVASSGNILDFTYGYNSSANNGNIASWSATGQQAFNRTYLYDKLNRLASMADSNASQVCQGMSWNIDAWGNMTNQNVQKGSCFTFQSSANTKNQLTGLGTVIFKYDAAGNMTYDGWHTYYYDAENRMIQVDGTLGNCSSANAFCYVYDAMGLRVRTTAPNGGSEWIHDLQGNVVSQFIINFGWGRGYVYLGSQQLAEYGDGTTYFIHRDHLNSTRLVTKLDGSTKDSYDYLPFGQITSGPPGGNSILHLFTGEEHDAETATGYGARDGFDYFGARYYASRLFRFMSPDPLSGSPENPQSWNRYSYVYNNPLNATDPSGMCSEDDGWSGCEWDTGWDSGNVNAYAWLWYSAPNYSVDTSGYEGWLNYSYGDPLASGPSLQTGGPLYANDGSYMSQIMNTPSLASNWTQTFNGATNLVNAGAAWTGVVMAAPFAAPAIAAAPGTIGSLGARGLGWGYALAGHTSRILFGGVSAYVIGRFDEYTQAAEAEGMGALNIWQPLYNTISRAGLWNTVNMAYLDAQIWLNEQVFLSNVPIGQEGSGFAEELKYLISKGIGPDQWRFVPFRHIY